MLEASLSSLNIPIIKSEMYKNGFRITIMACRVTHMKGTSFFQYFAPMVLGRISDRTKMARVMIPDASPR